MIANLRNSVLVLSLILNLNNNSNGKIIIVNKDEEKTPTEKLTKDIVSIMDVYVAKINGLQKYKRKMKEMIKNKRKE